MKITNLQFTAHESAQIALKALRHLHTTPSFAALSEAEQEQYLASLNDSAIVCLALELPPRQRGGKREGNGFAKGNTCSPRHPARAKAKEFRYCAECEYSYSTSTPATTKRNGVDLCAKCAGDGK